MEWVKLGDVGKIITGNTPSKKNKAYYDSPDINFVSPGDIVENNRINELVKSENHISNSAREKARIVPKNSILVTCIGIIGKVAKVKINEVAFNQQINAIVVDENKYDIDYIAYAIMANKRKLSSIANAAVVPLLNKSQFSDFKIFIAKSLEKQKEISSFLNKIENLIQTRQDQVQALDDLVESVFDQMFGSIKTNNTTLKKLIKFNNKNINDFENYSDLYYLGVEDIEKDTGKILSKAKVSDVEIKSSKKLFTDENVLYSRIRPNLNKVALPDFSGLISTEVYVLECSDKINKYFLTHVLRSNRFVKYAMLNSTGANFPRVSQQAIEGYSLYLPPIEKQNLFAAFVEKIEKQKQILNDSLVELTDLFDSLMQDAFDGSLTK